MKGFMKDGKFHPITDYNGVRKARDQKAKTQGVRIRDKSEPFEVKESESTSQKKLVQMQRADVGRRALDMGMSNFKMNEWENTINSKVVKVKHEMVNGRPVTTVRFDNGEEWFEFDSFDHQNEFMKENDFHKLDVEDGELVRVDHPMVSGFITMDSGKVLFGEKENKREKRDVTNQIGIYEDPSHGFFKVPNSLLKELEIQDDITKFSKRTPDFTFLEEDQDGTTFFNALKEKGIDVDINKIKRKDFDSANENPASVDFRLCDECGRTLASIEALKKHKAKGHKK